MRRELLCLAVLIVGSAPASSISLQAQTVTQPKVVAVTIDDLPLNGPQLEAGRLWAIKDTSDWLLHWSFSKGKKFAPPMPPDFIQKPYLDNQKRASPVTSSGQAQAPVPDKWPDRWVDYASADYDILPNITYSIANNTELKLDLYLPKNRSAPNPTLMLFHGGGWVDGQKERNVFQLLPYLSLGWAVINVEYRLARNSPAPAAVEDCRCALRWVTYHAKEYSLDTSKIVLTGISAGGRLALITGFAVATTAALTDKSL